MRIYMTDIYACMLSPSAYVATFFAQVILSQFGVSVGCWPPCLRVAPALIVTL